MLVISYILNKLSPIVNPLGVLGLLLSILVCADCGRFTVEGDYEAICSCSVQGFHMELYLVTIILAVVGLIYGIFAYKNDVPPRWTWSKSRNALFEFSIAAVLGYMVNFAMWPPCVFIVKYFIGIFQNI